MDPLSITVSALTFTAAIKASLQFLKRVYSLPSEVEELMNEISDLGLVLQLVDKFLRSPEEERMRARGMPTRQDVRLKAMVERAMAALKEVDALIGKVMLKKAKGIGTGQEGYVSSGDTVVDSSHDTQTSDISSIDVNSVGNTNRKVKIKWMASRKILCKLRSLKQTLQNVKLSGTLLLGIVSTSQSSYMEQTLHEFYTSLLETGGSEQRTRREFMDMILQHSELMQNVGSQLQHVSSKLERHSSVIEHETLRFTADRRFDSLTAPFRSKEAAGITTLTKADEQGEMYKRSAPSAVQTYKRPSNRLPHSGPQCAWGCNCSCHTRHRFMTADILNPVFGNLSAEVILPEAIKGKCNQRSCRSRSPAMAQVDYVFPSWLIMAMVSAKITIPSLYACNITLRAARIVPDSALIFRYAMEGNLAGVEGLLEDGKASAYDVDESNGTSALVYATDRGHVDVWRLLIRAGADHYLESKAKHSPIDAACTKIYTAETSSTSITTATTTTLSLPITFPTATLAALREDFEIEEYLEKRQFPLLHKIILGIHTQTPHPDATTTSLETQLALSTSEIDAVDYQGRTALSWAAIRGDSASLKTLLSYGADANLTAFNGDAPLHYAVRASNPDCIAPLLENRSAGGGKTNADVDARNVWRVNALCYAAANRDDVAYVLPLVRAGADLNLCDKHGRTALVRAVNLNRPRIVRCLLESGARLEVEVNTDDGSGGSGSGDGGKGGDLWGCQPLVTAIRNGFREVVDLLLEWSWSRGLLAMAQVDGVLHVARECGDVEAVGKLEGMRARLVDRGIVLST